MEEGLLKERRERGEEETDGRIERWTENGEGTINKLA
jgi:hypothetical protein